MIDAVSAPLKMPTKFDENSRVWLYTANRDLTETEINFIKEKLNSFIPNWTAHNNSLKAFGEILFDRVLMLVVDETQAGVSGCGIDKSVRFVENLGVELGVDFFDRMIVGYQKEGGSVSFLPINEFAQQIKLGILPKETLVVDPLVNTKLEFENSFFKPIESTWIRRFV